MSIPPTKKEHRIVTTELGDICLREGITYCSNYDSPETCPKTCSYASVRDTRIRTKIKRYFGLDEYL